MFAAKSLQNSLPWSERMVLGTPKRYIQCRIASATVEADLSGMAVNLQKRVKASVYTRTKLLPWVDVLRGPKRSI